MEKWSEQTVLQRRDVSGQEAQKMLHIVREMQIRSTRRCHLHTLGWLWSNGQRINRRCWGCGETETFIYCWCECKIRTLSSHLGFSHGLHPRGLFPISKIAGVGEDPALGAQGLWFHSHLALVWDAILVARPLWVYFPLLAGLGVEPRAAHMSPFPAQLSHPSSPTPDSLCLLHNVQVCTFWNFLHSQESCPENAGPPVLICLGSASCFVASSVSGAAELTLGASLSCQWHEPTWAPDLPTGTHLQSFLLLWRRTAMCPLCRDTGPPGEVSWWKFLCKGHRQGQMHMAWPQSRQNTGESFPAIRDAEVMEILLSGVPLPSVDLCVLIADEQGSGWPRPSLLGHSFIMAPWALCSV